MIIVTGAAGFIASNFISKLNSEGFKDIILVDDFSRENKNKNFENKIFTDKVDRKYFISWLKDNHKFVQFVFHLGARTDTTETNKEIFDELNFNYSVNIWKACCEFGLPLIYASSAATYGKGEYGYEDNHQIINNLKPLNEYGISKNEFDKWAIQQAIKPYFWTGLKFFNVYGPNEYHKGRMASVIFHSYNQIIATNKIKLFKSHNPGFEDGGQMRDFIYVKDVIEVLYFFLHHRKNSGIYNLGTGKARTFTDLALNTFSSLEIKANIEFIDTPADIRDNYQYFTEAKMEKLRSIGYNKEFYSLEEGVRDYVKGYLISGKIN
jgi:ADP-L-glycero-D-manno-heptose 6-epimerase